MKRAFISFDFDHDEDLRNLLAAGPNPDTPFEFANWSVREPMTGDWKDKVRGRIRSTELMIVICGEWTHTASGVAAELTIAREERKPTSCCGGARNPCTKPTSATAAQIYEWTWANLKALVGGAR